MPLECGSTFAEFETVRLLGSGGMGEVYLAKHPRLPRHEALKILPAEVSADTEFRKRFEREAEVASNLYHPHIVGVHDRGTFQGQLWISMDYVDGADAGQLLRDRYPAGMPITDVVEIVAAVADALDYAHENGLLHRDVKPSNILLSDGDARRRRILLSDFGIARRLSDISHLTLTNTTVGTVAYAAPEQLMAQSIDGRADQYALAATAYHLLTGLPVFSDPNPAVVITHHLNTQPPDPAHSRPELAPFAGPLSRALSKEPGLRFATCVDFADALSLAAGARRRRRDPADASITLPATPANIRRFQGSPSTGPGAKSLTKPRHVPAPQRVKKPPVSVFDAAAAGLILLFASSVIFFVLFDVVK